MNCSRGDFRAEKRTIKGRLFIPPVRAHVPPLIEHSNAIEIQTGVARADNRRRGDSVGAIRFAVGVADGVDP